MMIIVESIFAGIHNDKIHENTLNAFSRTTPPPPSCLTVTLLNEHIGLVVAN